VTQVLAALSYAGTLPFVDRKRIILVGNSTGGLAMVAARGMQLPEGVIGVVNFAGGAGGGVLGAGKPCNEPEVRRVIADAGKSAHLAMLWLYARDDEFWGPDLPREWHADYLKGGGRATFRQFDHGGHDLVSYPEEWGAALDAYLEGLPVRGTSDGRSATAR
jgi:dienelactone hydrolase